MSTHGRRQNGRWCWVRSASPLSADPSVTSVPQIGYAIGRSVGTAVVRNRIRRRIRAIVADHVAELSPGLYLIGVKNAQVATLDHDELRRDLAAVLERASVFASASDDADPSVRSDGAD